MRKLLIATLAIAALGAAPAFGSSNPSGTGQPNQSCGSAGATSQPAGFSTGGFNHATAVYAGSPGTPSAANGNSHAVSQYDVACFQVTSSGH
jgi:hypothetical protein